MTCPECNGPHPYHSVHCSILVDRLSQKVKALEAENDRLQKKKRNPDPLRIQSRRSDPGASGDGEAGERGMSEPEPEHCEYCMVAREYHDHAHLAETCYPQRIRSLQSIINNQNLQIIEMEDALERLEAENAELRKDRERLDFIGEINLVHAAFRRVAMPDDFRQAIDDLKRGNRPEHLREITDRLVVAPK